jgi:hypothetical protein
MYPLYRKYSNCKSFFRIESEKEFWQVQLIGEKPFKSKIVAETYPEMLFVQDLINMSNNFIQEATNEEIQTYLKF